ncbi:MAG: hypothetical protein ABI947_19495 [Chloroflexota bacterium]
MSDKLSTPVPKPPHPNPRHRLQADRSGVLIAAGIMAGVGWVLLYRLVTGPAPLAFPRWLFFILLYIAVTGTVLPLIWYLNQRFSRYSPVTGGILLRQGMWCGLFAVTAAWLQTLRALSVASAFFLALGLVVIETFLRLRERTQSFADRASRDE